MLYDILGRTVRQIDLGSLQPGSYEHPLNASSLASGAVCRPVEFVADRTGARRMSESMRLMLMK